MRPVIPSFFAPVLTECNVLYIRPEVYVFLHGDTANDTELPQHKNITYQFPKTAFRNTSKHEDQEYAHHHLRGLGHY